MMIRDLVFHPRFSSKEDGGATALLILISLFREDMPWLYEPGMELYRALRSQSSRDVARAREQLMTVIHATDHPMFFEMHRGGDDDTFMMLHELSHFVESSVRKIERRYRSRPRGRPVEVELGGPQSES
jgi:hypothetical protein